MTSHISGASQSHTLHECCMFDAVLRQIFKVTASVWLRMTADRQVGEKLYRRGDGTLCYFFSTEDLRSKAEAAGFEAVECKYACTRLLNRKKQCELRRVFVHGVFRKP